MATQTTDLVMIMSLRDQMSKDLKNANANLAKMKKALEGDSKAAKDANNWWKKGTTQLKEFNKALVALGVSSVVAGFGIKELVSASQQMASVNAQTQFSVSLLGPAAQQAYNDMKPQFAAIGSSVLATASQVNEAYGIMSSSSGKTILSTKDLQAAFAVAKVTGISFETAAQDIGMALRGNQDPLRQLVGPYGYKGLADVENKAGIAAKNNFTALDQTSYQFGVMKNQIASVLMPVLNVLITVFNKIPMPIKAVGIVLIVLTAGIIAAAMAVLVFAGAWAVLSTVMWPVTLAIGAAILVVYEIIKHWGAVWGWVKTVAIDAINGIIGAINTMMSPLRLLTKALTFGKVNLSIPTIKTATPHANGGMVTEPTAMIGLKTGKRGTMAENGPEAIVPSGRGGGGGQQVVFNIHGTLIDRNSLRDFAQQITPLLQQNNRRGGAAAPTYG